MSEKRIRNLKTELGKYPELRKYNIDKMVENTEEKVRDMRTQQCLNICNQDSQEEGRGKKETKAANYEKWLRIF